MKKIILKLRKNKKAFFAVVVGLALILVGWLSWVFFFSRYYIFHNQEKDFLDAAKRYYEFNEMYLPKKGETREITLQNLYDSEHINTLYIPKTRKTCDSEQSWVRVYQNEDGEYQYATYLKCGRFQSHIDHDGPEITLNGDIDIIIPLGSEYQELGVSKVYDKKDGDLDASLVTIDSSSVDITKIGTYPVTYTVRDHSFNKTVVTRNVTVAQNLTDIVRNNTDDSNYYRGLNPNNYLLFSGMLFRIVNVNEDGSVKIVSYDNISNIPYGPLETDYDKSNIPVWLNKAFYNSLNNPDQYVVQDSKWCLDYADFENYVSDTCTTTTTNKVGLLTLSDWNKSMENGATYLNTVGEYWLLTRQNAHYVYIHSMMSGGIDEVKSTSLNGAKPALNLKSGLYITSGNGTSGNPYRLGDYSYGKTHDLVNSRLVGEYINYSGMIFRIGGFDEDHNTKLVSVLYLGNLSTQKYFYSSYQNEDNIMKFNPKQEGNIGYQLNNEYIDFIDDSLIVNHDYSLYQYDENVDYTHYKVDSTFKSKLSIPSSFELFSGVNESYNSQVNYWLLDYVDEQNAFMINSSNGRTFNIGKGFYDSNAFKIVFYLKNTAKISSGNGTSVDPYYVK